MELSLENPISHQAASDHRRSAPPLQSVPRWKGGSGTHSHLLHHCPLRRLTTHRDSGNITIVTRSAQATPLPWRALQRLWGFSVTGGQYALGSLSVVSGGHVSTNTLYNPPGVSIKPHSCPLQSHSLSLPAMLEKPVYTIWFALDHIRMYTFGKNFSQLRNAKMQIFSSSWFPDNSHPICRAFRRLLRQ